MPFLITNSTTVNHRVEARPRLKAGCLT